MPKGVYKRKLHTEEWRRQHSADLMGHKVSNEIREKIRLGNVGVKRSLETRHKNSIAAKGHKRWLGKKHSEESKRKISEFHKGKCFSKPPLIKGEAHWNWKGGITPTNLAIRTSQIYLKWRIAVFKRDNFTCRDCGDNTGGNLEANHIKPFAYFPELRLELENGRTLCKPCHKKTDTWGAKVRKYVQAC